MSDPGSAEGEHDGPSVEQRLDAVAEALARLRALVIRAYEGTPRATTELLKARRSPAYAEAYAPDPMVTVRIGAYAGGDTLFERAIASVRRQTYANWEAIVVCDGRDEQTAQRISALGDARIRCFQRPRNGPYPDEQHARWLVAGAHPFNEGFARARGAWIAPIDQDDEWEDYHLGALVSTAQSSEAEVAYGVARVVVADHGETYFGAWPPAMTDFAFQTAIHHAGLTDFLYDANAHLVDEPADWNLARRMLEAGVRFEFLDRAVTTYYIEKDAPSIGWWLERLQQRGAYIE